SWRSIWGNPEIQRKFIFDAYKYIEPGSKAFLFLNDSYAKANPHELGVDIKTQVTIDYGTKANFENLKTETKNINSQAKNLADALNGNKKVLG
ncbi:hypothetical protein PO81_21635, partial [Vibrio parahaemolyticus]